MLQLVSYPDDNAEDPAKPKKSAVLWKNENEWVQNENVLSLQNYTNLNSEDSKTSLEDAGANDENCIYKDERDSNFNMETSNSSESCQSMKDILIKQDIEPPTSVLSSTTITVPSINSTTIAQNVRSTGKKTKSGKDSTRCVS